MSTSMTGADLSNLEELVAEYGEAGAAIAAKAGELRNRIARAVTSFDATMVTLRADTASASRAMDEEIDDLALTAGAVAWTGTNRAAFDHDVQRFTAQVHAGTAALNEGVDELRTGGVDRFTAMLDEFGAVVTDAGDGVELASGEIRTSVAGQRDALDHAGNIGWTAA